MNLPLQITFRNMNPSEFVARRICSEALKLARYFNRINTCRVTVEAPHRHHRRGTNFHVEIELAVPRERIVIRQVPNLRRVLAQSDADQKWVKHLETGAAHKDLYVTIRDAFKSARRRLEDYVRCLRGDIKMHGRVPALRRDKLTPSLA